MPEAALDLAQDLAARLAAFPQVDAVAWAGSRTAARADALSDIDLYVYLTGPLPPEQRAALAAARGTEGTVEIDNRFFETGDEWADAATGLGVDIMYRDPAWIEGELDRVLSRHEASIGYTTCICFNIATSKVLLDRHGWLERHKAIASRSYPEGLRRAIIAKNLPLLRTTRSSFAHQIETAARRGDRIAVNHRVAAFLASYFDVLFAFNRRLHPGEKRLLAHATAPGMVVPDGMDEQLDALLATASKPSTENLASSTAQLAAGIEALVAEDTSTVQRRDLPHQEIRVR